MGVKKLNIRNVESQRAGEIRENGKSSLTFTSLAQKMI